LHRRVGGIAGIAAILEIAGLAKRATAQQDLVAARLCAGCDIRELTDL
jgi:hypothetical protein